MSCWQTFAYVWTDMALCYLNVMCAYVRSSWFLFLFFFSFPMQCFLLFSWTHNYAQGRSVPRYPLNSLKNKSRTVKNKFFCSEHSIYLNRTLSIDHFWFRPWFAENYIQCICMLLLTCTSFYSEWTN
jgi:hypothetical protein